MDTYLPTKKTPNAEIALRCVAAVSVLAAALLLARGATVLGWIIYGAGWVPLATAVIWGAYSERPAWIGAKWLTGLSVIGGIALLIKHW